MTPEIPLTLPEPADTPPVVRVTGLWKSFNEIEVLTGVDLEVTKGEVIALMGRSGSGKTTLLRCLNLLEVPDRGVVEVAGQRAFDDRIVLSRKDLVRYRRRIGMVFQSFHLFPHLTAVENVMLPLIRGLGVAPDPAAATALTLLSRVGLSDKIRNLPEQLSGGQQQRVAIARALALRPVALLFDEPTSALDPESTQEVLAVMRELSSEGMTMVVVTHEIGFARDAADRVVFMAQGAIVEQGTPTDVIDHPRDPRARDFMGHEVKRDTTTDPAEGN